MSGTDIRLLESPLGRLELRGNGRAVTWLSLAEAETSTAPVPYLEEAARQVKDYFGGKRRELDFPVDPAGTSFQRRVWAALREIPYGCTETYGALAARIGHPGAARAVGSAAGKNPCLLIIPCHRLLAAGGLGGFALGLERKRLLLALEAGHAET